MEDIKIFKFSDLEDFMGENDSGVNLPKTPSIPQKKEVEIFEKKLIEKIKIEEIGEKTILGIDIYRYSQYKPELQFFIPFLFKTFMKQAVSSCIKEDEFFFQKYKDEAFKKFFIDTGDGGFQIFETPLHAIIYTIYFALAVRVFNSFHFYPKLRKLIGPITLRYAITYDSIYKIGGHFYGTSIINNARILSKDSLNRFLIDQNTQEWFMLNINGVEHLPNLILNEIKKLDPFNIDYDSNIECDPGIFPDLPLSGPQKRGSHIIQSVCVQKIEDIEVKGIKFSIYNLQIQAFLRIFWEDDKTGKKSPQLPLTITIGNLNTSGLN